MQTPIVRSQKPLSLHLFWLPGQDTSKSSRHIGDLIKSMIIDFPPTNWSINLYDYLLFSPLQIVPSNPSLHMHNPTMSSHVPWFEQRPSSGQSISVNGISYLKSYVDYHKCKWKDLYLKSCSTTVINRKIISLEQSRSCLPGSHVHCPTSVSQTPAPLQSAGHFSSRTWKKDNIRVQMIILWILCIITRAC